MADVREVNLDNIVIIVNDVIKDYCENRNIDINDIPPQIWNDIIDEIYITVFKDNNTLLRCVPKQGLNKYDINMLE